MADEAMRLGLYESRTIMALTTRAAGVHEQKLAIEGNSLLSTVFVESLDPGAAVSVTYHDAGVGEDAGEDILVGSHPTLTLVGSNRRVLAPFHNKPRLVVTVTGGQARFGVYVTVIQQIAVDLLNALHLDAALANLASDVGIGVSIYDPVQGKFFLWRGAGGVPEVELANAAGEVREIEATISPGPIDVLLSETVPVGETWRIHYGEVACRAYTRWRLELDGARIGGGVTGPAREHDRAAMPGYVEASAGQVIEVRYTYASGPSNIDIDGFIGITRIL